MPSILFPRDLRLDSRSQTPRGGKAGTSRSQGQARAPGRSFCEAAAQLSERVGGEVTKNTNHSEAKNNKSDAVTCLT